MTKAHAIFKDHGVRSVTVARALNITKSAISQWRVVPLDRLAEVSTVTGIPREKLRPDLYAGMVYVGDGSQ